MNRLTFTLHALDRMIELYPVDNHERERHLLEHLRSRVSTDEDLKSFPGLSTEEMIHAVLPAVPPVDLARAAIELETLRASLNSQLLKMIDGGQNPSGFLVDEHFRFIQLKRHTFQPSELAFRIPHTLHGELRDKLALLEKQNAEEITKLDALNRREQELVHSQTRREQNETQSRSVLLEQIEGLKKAMDRQRRVFEKEILRLQNELTRLKNHSETHLSDVESSLAEGIEIRSSHDEEFREHLRPLDSSLGDLEDLTDHLKRQEQHLIDLKKKDRERIRKRERFLKKSADSHLERIRMYDQRLAELNQQETERRKQQEREFQNKIQELQQDFRRQLVHFQIRSDEDAAHSKKLAEERHELMLKKQALSGEIQSRTEEHLRNRQEELIHRESRVETMLKQLTHLAGNLAREKQAWLGSMKTEGGTLYLRSELESMIEEQSSLTRKLKSLAGNMETLKDDSERAADERHQQFEKQVAEQLRIIEDERTSLKESRDELIEKKNILIERELQELARLHEDYEDLRLSLEVSQIEKAEHLDSREHDITQRELNLQARFQEYQDYREQCRKELRDQEEQIQSELEDLLSAKLELDSWKSEARNFFNDFRNAFSRRLNAQKSELRQFREAMQEHRESADILRQQLETETQMTKANHTEQEQTLEERIQRHQECMESLEKELRSRVEKYVKEHEALRKSRQEVQSRDQETMQSFVKNLAQYESKLHAIGQAFEELSDTLSHEQALGGLQLIEEEPVAQPLPPQAMEQFSEENAQREWETLLHHLMVHEGGPLPSFPVRYLDEWAEPFNQWEEIPPGAYAATAEPMTASPPPGQLRIEAPFQVSRFPVTNLEFMRFVLNTGYRTEAERENGGIVYFSGMSNEEGAKIHFGSSPTLEPIAQACWWRPDGSSDSLKYRANHPVTLISWTDAQVYCQWKSQQTGTVIRLPRETEWDYIACNRGTGGGHLPWREKEITRFCNLEESGIGGTTPVDFFPAHDRTCGAQDLFGNVYEWVQDGTLPPGRSPNLDYRLVRGGSFITQYHQLMRWRRLPFLVNYRTSFIGFRLVSETTPETPVLP